MARALLLTDEPILAAGFTSVLANASGFENSAVCAAPSQLADAVQAHGPDVLLIDLTPEITFGVLTQLRRDFPQCRLVLWVRSISTELAYQAMEMGVRGVLRKTLAPDLLTKCLRKVAEGELWFDKNLTASFLSAKMVSLTKRESQLVGLLSQGLKNKEIAGALSISEGTVKVYLSRLFQKVGVKDRFELALYGLRNLQQVGAEAPSATSPVAAEAALSRRPAQLHPLRSLVLERTGAREAQQFPYWAARS